MGPPGGEPCNTLPAGSLLKGPRSFQPWGERGFLVLHRQILADVAAAKPLSGFASPDFGFFWFFRGALSGNQPIYRVERCGKVRAGAEFSRFFPSAEGAPRRICRIESMSDRLIFSTSTTPDPAASADRVRAVTYDRGNFSRIASSGRNLSRIASSTACRLRSGMRSSPATQRFRRRVIACRSRFSRPRN